MTDNSVKTKEGGARDRQGTSPNNSGVGLWFVVGYFCVTNYPTTRLAHHKFGRLDLMIILIFVTSVKATTGIDNWCLSPGRASKTASHAWLAVREGRVHERAFFLSMDTWSISPMVSHGTLSFHLSFMFS